MFFPTYSQNICTWCSAFMFLNVCVICIYIEIKKYLKKYIDRKILMSGAITFLQMYFSILYN